MDLGLKDRVALVTGSSRGIGRAVARGLAREGARVAVTYRSDRDRAEGVAAAIRDGGGDALVVPLDLASPDTISAAVRAAVDRWGRIDILVNNAVASGGPEEVRSRDWQPLLHANVDGAYAAIQAAVPAMRARSWGRIVNISSGPALDGLPGAGPHAAAKAALNGLTRTLAKELGPAGILVNVVMPGLTLTERNVESLPAAVREKAAQASPLRRLLHAEEIAPTVVFLCSAANTAVTGALVRAGGAAG
jgi:3-oxoacyl-[acyl-carrier protein] reductase